MTKQSRFVWISALLVLLATTLIWFVFGRDNPVQASASSRAEEDSESWQTSAQESSAGSPDGSGPEFSGKSETTDTVSEFTSAAGKEYQPLTFSTVRAVWISYIDFQELTMGADETVFREKFTEVIGNCSSLGVNTLYLHVRPFADAMYPSELFPWSKYASGRQGVDPGYDPLGIVLELAHAEGVAVHAWINPFRISRDPESYLCPENIGLVWQEKDQGLVREVDGGLYFNPACPEVVSLVADGVDELCRKYDLDGIHFDDYFYPTTDESFDADQYASYTLSGGKKSLDDWRRENVDTLVARVHEVCSGYDVPFGISPAGNLDYCYFTQYANIARWMNEPGYVDYIVPQIYWGFEHASKPFEETLESWQSICSPDVPLICGLAAYKAGTEDGNTEWLDSHDVLARQTESCTRHNTAGCALYRYGSLFNPVSSAADAAAEELEALRERLME